MAATVRGAIHELLEQTMVTMGALLEASDRELAMPSSHACAQGKDAWTPPVQPPGRRPRGRTTWQGLTDRERFAPGPACGHCSRPEPP
jgi:hypothetical protein